MSTIISAQGLGKRYTIGRAADRYGTLRDSIVASLRAPFNRGKNDEESTVWALKDISFSVEPGDYAIAVYHDQNGNGKMDKRMFGIPKEPYGFSNNIKPVMSAPKFSECRFTVGDSGKAISIKLL